jgi:hypothetical protein
MRGKFKWWLYKKYVKPLPTPSRKEQGKIKSSLGLDTDHPLPRCPGKCAKTVRGLEAKGDFSHSGSRKAHLCEVCRCRKVAGWGTKHYGVGYCYYHDVDNGRIVSKTMAIALQQGYPLNPIKYRSENDYIEAVRAMAEAAHGRLDLGEELVLLRSHIQELENLYHKTGAEALTMKGNKGPEPMTDDVKLDKLTKLVKAVSDLSRDSYVITESDYVHIDEVKVWLWQIYRLIEDKCKRLITGELNPNDMLPTFQECLKSIVLPKTGRKNK